MHVSLKLVLLCGLALVAAPASAQAPTPARTILAIGAHAGDMELTAGAVLLGAHASAATAW